MDAFGLSLIILSPYFLYKIYQNINYSKNFYFIDKKIMKKKIEEEYSNNNYLKITAKKIKKIAKKELKRYRRKMNSVKIYLIMILVLYALFSQEIRMESMQITSICVHTLYLLIIIRKEFKVKREVRKDKSFIDFFVTYYLFEIFVQKDLISDLTKIPDKYILQNYEEKGEMEI